MMATNSSDTSKINFYDLLNVPHSATPEDVLKAYKQRARIIHPDKSGEQNTELFQLLVKAKDTLVDRVKRAEYDEEHEDDTSSKIAGALSCGELNCLSNVKTWSAVSIFYTS